MEYKLVGLVINQKLVEARSTVKKKYITLSLVFGMIALLIYLFIIIFQNPKSIVVMNAEVLENRGNALLVSSRSEPYGKYSVSFMENKEAVFDKDGNKISISDIPEGSTVKIEYDGWILEVSPGRIHGTSKIEIIETPSHTN